MKHFEKDGCRFEMRDFFLNKEKCKRNYCSVHNVFVCDRCNASFADHYSGGMWACAFNPQKKEEKAEMTIDEFMKKPYVTDKTQPGVVTQIINCHHRPTK
jgi:hypothetical protein